LTGSDEKARRVLQECAGRGWSLSVAESCTGGLVGGCLTSIPGSSNVFLGGVIAYSNWLKIRLLGVPSEIIDARGAVSEETALAMARGAVNLTGADCGISVTGIAGPDGGTPEKPVGTVWFAVVSPLAEVSRSYLFQGEREEVRRWSVRAALDLFLEALDRGSV